MQSCFSSSRLLAVLLCAAVGLSVVAWSTREGAAGDAPNPRALAAERRDGAPDGSQDGAHRERVALEVAPTPSLEGAPEPRAPQRVAATEESLGSLFPELAELRIIALAGGHPVDGATLVLKGLGDVSAAPGALRDPDGALITDAYGRARVALRPMSTFRGTLTRPARRAGEARLAAEFVATSPRPGSSRAVEVELEPTVALGFVHLAVQMIPDRFALAGARLTLLQSSGRPPVDPDFPVEYVTDGAGRVALIWPADLVLRVEAQDATTCDYRWPKGAARERIPVAVDADEARAAVPIELPLPRVGSAFGTFDPARRHSGTVTFTEARRQAESRTAIGAPVTAHIDEHGFWRLERLPTQLPEDPERDFRGASLAELSVEFELSRTDGQGSLRCGHGLRLEPGEERELVDPFVSFVAYDVEVRVGGERGPEGMSVRFDSRDTIGWTAAPPASSRGLGAAGTPRVVTDAEGTHHIVEVGRPAPDERGGAALTFLKIQGVVDATGHLRFDAPAAGRFVVTGQRRGRRLHGAPRVTDETEIERTLDGVTVPLESGEWTIAEGTWSPGVDGLIELVGR